MHVPRIDSSRWGGPQNVSVDFGYLNPQTNWGKAYVGGIIGYKYPMPQPGKNAGQFLVGLEMLIGKTAFPAFEGIAVAGPGQSSRWLLTLVSPSGTFILNQVPINRFIDPTNVFGLGGNNWVPFRFAPTTIVDWRQSYMTCTVGGATQAGIIPWNAYYL